MRHTGVLQSWNDERGYGFIAPTQGGLALFVHISAFPPDGTRPGVGERLEYQPGSGRDGKPQAFDVVRMAVGRAPAPPRSADPGPRPGRRRIGPVLLTVLLLALLVGVAVLGPGRHGADAPTPDAPDADRLQAAPRPGLASSGAATAWRCDGRAHCSQMSSCDEARWFLDHCPGMQMDGDGDGIPCETQWCTGAFD